MLQSNSKLDGRVAETRWIGFDPQTANGHRIYWPGRHSVLIEHNITFDPSSPVHIPDVSDDGPPAEVMLDLDDLAPSDDQQQDPDLALASPAQDNPSLPES